MRIDVAARAGTVAAGRGVASALRDEVEMHAAHGTVELDFTGVDAVAPSFADELVAKLPGGLLEGGAVVIVAADGATRQIVDLVRRRRVAV